MPIRVFRVTFSADSRIVFGQRLRFYDLAKACSAPRQQEESPSKSLGEPCFVPPVRSKPILDNLRDRALQLKIECSIRGRFPRNIPDIITEDYAYQIVPVTYVPIDTKDIQEVTAFIEALAQTLKISDGKKLTDAIKKHILPDTFDLRNPTAEQP